MPTYSIKDLLKLNALLGFETACLIFTLVVVLLAERFMIFFVMLSFSDSTTTLLTLISRDTYNVTFFSSQVLTWNCWFLHLFPCLSILIIPLHPSRPQFIQSLPGKVKLAASAILSMLYMFSHIALYMKFQRLLSSTRKEMQDSHDLVVILFLLLIIFYFHFKVHFLWLDYVSSKNTPLFYNIYSLSEGHTQFLNHVITHLELYYPIILTAIIVQVLTMDGLPTYVIMTCVGAATGGVVSWYHSKSAGATMLMDPFLHFGYVEVMLFVGLFFGWTQAIFNNVVHAKMNSKVPEYALDLTATNHRIIHFSVTMAAQVIYSAKAVVFLVRISPEYYGR